MLQALYFLDSYQIINGQKTALATVSPCPLDGKHLLIIKDKDGAYFASGLVTIDKPQSISLTEFDARIKEHGISSIQRLKWWPTTTELVLHPIHSYLAFLTPQPLDIAPPSGKRVELVGLNRM